MTTLTAQERLAGAKGKQLRREGTVPGVLYGKHLDESVMIQFKRNDLEFFLRDNMVGSTVELIIGGEKQLALLRAISYTPVKRELEHVNFQALVAGEAVTSEFRIVLINRDLVEGVVQQNLNEVSYRALPSKLTDMFEVDLAGKVPGDTAVLDDFDFAHDPDFEILTALDSSVYTITESTLELELEELDEEEAVEGFEFDEEAGEDAAEGAEASEEGEEAAE
ncbi:MAG: 50S ribosomal protein L25 [Clostridiales bacterium]|nr:50S ribosomal protein L25 [Clostridiales bacterium]